MISRITGGRGGLTLGRLGQEIGEKEYNIKDTSYGTQSGAVQKIMILRGKSTGDAGHTGESSQEVRSSELKVKGLRSTFEYCNRGAKKIGLLKMTTMNQESFSVVPIAHREGHSGSQGVGIRELV